MRVITVGLLLAAGLWLGACLDSKRQPDAGHHDAGGSGGSGGSSGISGTGGSGGTSGTGGTSGAGGSGGCSPACQEGRECCAGRCVNLNNDPHNCGACGGACAGLTSICSQGVCTERPCAATCADQVCCGSQCCGAGQLCCDIEGPVGGVIGCVDPIDGTCPQGCAPLCICNSPDTAIATVDGERPIAALSVGDLVYSVHEGAVVLVPIARIHRVPVTNHHVMHVVLSSGAVLEVSPSHPLTDGRTLGQVRAGDMIDHATVISAELVAYAHDFTYDILPASDTGHYVAGGVLIASTLR